MINLTSTNNLIIQEKTPPFLEEVHQAELKMNIKHQRTRSEPKPKAKFRADKGGDINTISIGLTKGLIMTHKGAGAHPESRTPKPFFNPAAEKFSNELADALAENTGDVISQNILIR